MALLLRKTKQLSQDIDQTSRDTLEALEDDWLFIIDDLNHRTKEKFGVLETQLETQNAELKEMLGLGQLTEAGKLVVDLVLESLRIFYRFAVCQTILSLEEENLLSKSDLKELGLSTAELTRTIALDFVPGSGTLLWIFNLVSAHLSGEEIEERLWNSWTDKIRQEKSYDLLQRANRKALVVIRFFAEYHLLSLINVLHFENVTTESLKTADNSG